ncbi:MAG: hypothetical protein WCJ40_03255 [Planctomycetota bacterium]|nr:hypothetical protein [Planctomycetota bacterium]
MLDQSMDNAASQMQIQSPENAGSEVPPKTQVIELVRRLAIEFLKTNCEARRVQVVNMSLIDSARGVWAIEANAFVPNITIQNLGLEVSKEVLDAETYVLKIDGQLNIIGFGLKSLVDD